MDEASRKHFRDKVGIRTLLFGVLAGPMAWVAQFQINYAASAHLCESAWTPLLHVVSAGAFAMATLGFFAARRSWVRAGRPKKTDGPSVIGRTRLMTLGGMIGSAFFMGVILVQAMPNFLFDPCPP
jgi:hypothetical protein